ncbi:hypothetical protein BJ508DRAFT_416181 [Ascobolus immersus RN42]|uniref:Uncharacterized protein n=1 Tax=Ascobolus immersus RN42 TaxID=1160509 RepID=A0A3N4HZ30_ASCIM|nr:hypothetical protein BJ508DRAFT_416181 [Ascobolus immersus RN42]
MLKHTHINSLTAHSNQTTYKYNITKQNNKQHKPQTPAPTTRMSPCSKDCPRSYGPSNQDEKTAHDLISESLYTPETCPNCNSSSSSVYSVDEDADSKPVDSKLSDKGMEELLQTLRSVLLPRKYRKIWKNWNHPVYTTIPGSSIANSLYHPLFMLPSPDIALWAVDGLLKTPLSPIRSESDDDEAFQRFGKAIKSRLSTVKSGDNSTLSEILSLLTDLMNLLRASSGPFKASHFMSSKPVRAKGAKNRVRRAWLNVKHMCFSDFSDISEYRGTKHQQWRNYGVFKQYTAYTKTFILLYNGWYNKPGLAWTSKKLREAIKEDIEEVFDGWKEEVVVEWMSTAIKNLELERETLERHFTL